MSRTNIEIMTDLAAAMLAFSRRGDIADDDTLKFADGRSVTVGELLDEADEAIGASGLLN